MMRCEIFNDPLYNGERTVEFDPRDVVALEEKTMQLLLRPKRRVTIVTLRNGDRHILDGAFAEQIRAAQSEAQPRESA